MDAESKNQESEAVSTKSHPPNQIWPEVKRAFDTKRYELTLIGPEISKRIEDANGQLDPNIFKLKQLNFLEIAKTKLTHLPPEIGQNQNMLSLLCHTNAISTVPVELGKLVLLKNLDLSNNKLTELPVELENLIELSSINLSGNLLTSLFPLAKLTKLAVLDVSRNKFKKLPDDLGSASLENLSDINASFNELEELNENLVDLQSLKKFNLENNQIKQVPAVLSQCVKLKDLMLKENKLKDNRLKKLVEQDKGKAILEYLERIYAEENKNKPKKAAGDSASKGKKAKSQSESAQIEYDLIKVLHSQNETFPSKEIVQSESVGELRPYILAIILRQIDLEAAGNFKKFLSIQTKLHDETCQKRTLATIATHDLDLLKGNLTYEAADPDNVQLVPLGRKNPVFASDYYQKLMEEAEAERKAKKRNQLSGIYKYLTLLEGHEKFVFVSDSQGVISLPPLSNAEKSKISASSKDILVEITSSSSIEICKKVMDELILEMLRAGIVSTSDMNEKLASLSLSAELPTDGKLKHTLIVQQVRIMDSKGALKTVFPSRVDFEFEGSSKIRVARLYAD